MPPHRSPGPLVRRTVLGLLSASVAVAALAACGDDAFVANPSDGSVADPADGSVGPSPGPSAEDVAERARAIPSIDEVRLVYLDPDGAEHDALPTETAGQDGWVARIDIVHDVHGGSGWATETVAGLVAGWPPSSTPSLEIWLNPTADAEVVARAYPAPANGSDPVRDAYLMAATPGVVRAVFDGETADVRVRDESDLAKVGDVAATHAVHTDQIRTADDAAVLDVATVPARPPHVVVPLPWPGDPSAPDCSPDDLWFALAGSDAATGHRGLAVAATNVGAEPCAVEGYPELAFRSLDEQTLDVTVTHGSSFMAQDPGSARVVIPSGARVLAAAGWNAMPTAEYPEGSGNRPAVTAEILLTVAPGAAPVELPLTSFALTADQLQDAGLTSWDPMTTLDIVNDGHVELTAWAPEGTKF